MRLIEFEKNGVSSLEDQLDAELQVPCAGSWIRAAERDRAAGQAAEVPVVGAAKPP